MKKKITIQWDNLCGGLDIQMSPKEIPTAELIGILEWAQLALFENKKKMEVKEKLEGLKKESVTKKGETPIGAVRELGGKKFRCVDALGRDCEDCALNINEAGCSFPLGECYCGERADHMDVIFVEERKKEDCEKCPFNEAEGCSYSQDGECAWEPGKNFDKVVKMTF